MAMKLYEKITKQNKDDPVSFLVLCVDVLVKMSKRVFDHDMD
jgi:hypothetical protein